MFKKEMRRWLLTAAAVGTAGVLALSGCSQKTSEGTGSAAETSADGSSAAAEAGNENGGRVNTVYDANKSFFTVSGEEIKPGNERFSEFPTLGFGMLVPEEWDEIVNLNFVMVTQGFCISFIPPSVMPFFENMTEKEAEEFDFEDMYSKQLYFMKVFYVPSETSEEKAKASCSEYQEMELLGTLEGNTYYIAYNAEIPEKERENLKEDDLKAYEKVASNLEAVKKGIAIFPIQKAPAEEAISTEDMQNLQAVDMKGNPVDAGIFSDYDITAVNIWATWCGPCVGEMPDLAEVYKNLPENANLITICTDGAEERETAEEILSQAGAEFITICGDEEMSNGLLGNVYSLPTTVFVNRNGELVGSPYVGAGSYDEYMKEITSRLEQ